MAFLLKPGVYSGNHKWQLRVKELISGYSRVWGLTVSCKMSWLKSRCCKEILKSHNF